MQRIFFNNLLLTFILVFGISSTFTLLFYSQKIQEQNIRLIHDSEVTLDLMKYSLESELGQIIQELKVLSEHIEQEHIYHPEELSDPKKSAILENEMAVYSLGNFQDFDQLRFVDSSGLERIRINYRNKIAYPVPTAQLQNKKHRYYFTETMRLNADRVYISPLDLNIEHNKIEHPLKPMIRIGIPLFNNAGQKTACLLANYLGQNLINRLHQLAPLTPGNVLLLNTDGYCLVNLKYPEKQWRFMYDNSQSPDFIDNHPEVWQKLALNDDLHFSKNQEVFIGKSVYPVLNSLNKEPESKETFTVFPENYKWIAIIQLEKTTIENIYASLKKDRNKVLWMLRLISSLIAWVMAQIRSRKVKAEQDLQQSEKRYRSLFHDNISAILLVHPENGKIVDCNLAASGYYGYSCKQLAGMKYRDLTDEDNENVCARMSEDNDNLQRIFQQKHIRTDKQIRDVSVLAGKITVNETELLYLTIYDNTAEKNALKQLKERTAQLIQSEKTNAVGTLTAGVAHELNNPLMGILNYTEYCKKHSNPENKAYPIFDEILKETIRCTDIVKGLLTFSHKSDSDKDSAACDALSEVKNCMKLINLKIKSTDIRITLPEKSHIRPSRISAGELQQVLFNILDNAVYAVSDREVKEINIRFSENINYNEIHISDSGKGISKEAIAKIFDPFFTTKPVGVGTGLGLSISKNIVESTKGTILIQSKWNKGTTFTLKLRTRTT